MAAETVHTSGGRWRTASGVFAVLAMLFVLLGLTWLRRNPDPISVAFERGNTLGTHEGSGMSAADFSRALGHVELAILVSLLAICARRWARGPLVAACAATIGFVGIYVVQRAT